MEKHISKKQSNQKKIIYSILAVIVIGALLIGFSRAWFYNQMDMETLMEIKPPANIAILGPDGSEMTSLDLNSADATPDADGKVTIRRVICVQSEADFHKLEIVHTTNLNGIEFKLYKAEKNDSGNITDQGKSFRYDVNNLIAGHYVNKRESTSTYKYANNNKHEQNFEDNDKVQSHAEPLYWVTDNNLAASTSDNVIIDEKRNHRTYYVCEVSWTETTKETDVFYILAETAQSNSSN